MPNNADLMVIMPIHWLNMHKVRTAPVINTRQVISAKVRTDFLTPSQTDMSKEVKSASESSSPQASFSHLDPWFPAELVMEIVKFLPLYELIVSARLTNKMWNTFAADRATAIIGEWVSSLKHPVPGDIEILYRWRAYESLLLQILSSSKGRGGSICKVPL
jgi:hypothetical protein